MRDDRRDDDARGDAGSSEPYRRSGSGEDYDPAANWAAERRLDHPSGGIPHGIEGAPSGAGDGGFGPEGDYEGAAGQQNADVIGQVNGDRDALVQEAHEVERQRAAERSARSDEERDTDRAPRDDADLH